MIVHHVVSTHGMDDGCGLRILGVDHIPAEVKPSVPLEAELALTLLTDELHQCFTREADGSVGSHACLTQACQILAGLGILAQLSISLGEVEIRLCRTDTEDIAGRVIDVIMLCRVVDFMIGPPMVVHIVLIGDISCTAAVILGKEGDEMITDLKGRTVDSAVIILLAGCHEDDVAKA